MRCWLAVGVALGLTVGGAVRVPESRADVFCKKKKGAVVVRPGSACKGGETLLDLSAFGAKGDKGDPGDPGPPGPYPTTNLPSGVTLRGAYRAGGQATAGGGIAQGAVTFAFPLASEPTPHYLDVGDAPIAECPGNVVTPAANPGHLCLYEQFAGNVTGKNVGNPTTNVAPGCSRYGFTFGAQSSAGGNFSAVGTWAVTAP